MGKALQVRNWLVRSESGPELRLKQEAFGTICCAPDDVGSPSLISDRLAAEIEWAHNRASK